MKLRANKERSHQGLLSKNCSGYRPVPYQPPALSYSGHE
jgi:hypothetical protein